MLGAYAELRRLPGSHPNKPFTEDWSAAVRTTLMVRALGDYGRLMIVPANLHMERTIFDPDNYLSRDSWRKTVAFEYLSILGLAVLVISIWGCIRRGAGQRLRIIGGIWFFAAYLPISNIVQLNATVAEHWLYLPSVGFLLFLGGCALDLPRRFRVVLTGFAVVAIVALSARSMIRSSDWSDEETFYQRTLAAGGASSRVRVNLAQIYASRGEYATAEILRQIVENSPGYLIACNNLANVLAREGKTAEAEALFAGSRNQINEAKNIYPRTWILRLNLAAMRSQAKNDDAAIKILEQARTENPQVWELIETRIRIVAPNSRSGPSIAPHRKLHPSKLVASCRLDHRRSPLRGKSRPPPIDARAQLCRLA